MNKHANPASIDVNAIKLAAASIETPYDEPNANATLDSIRSRLVKALGGTLELIQARILEDCGDDFAYTIRDVATGTDPEDAYSVLEENGLIGQDDVILSLRGLTADGKFYEIPFCADKPVGHIDHWLSVRVAPGARVSRPDEVWTGFSVKEIQNLLG